MKDEALRMALEAAYLAGFNASGEGYNGEYPFQDHNAHPEQDAGWVRGRDNKLSAIKQALAAPVQEPVAWKWHQAPVKTSWGHDMAVADLAIDKDNTVSVYCERDQTTKVEAMLAPPAAQRQWVGLTDEERMEIYNKPLTIASCIGAVEAKLKEKNA
jgi:hypothetical protein